MRVVQQGLARLTALYNADDAAVGVDVHLVKAQRAHLRLHTLSDRSFLAAGAGQSHEILRE